MDTWQMKLAVTINADDLDNLALLLREVARRIKRGETQGNENHCAGVYSFDVADDQGAPDNGCDSYPN